MRPSAVLGEAWRNLATGTTRALLLALLLASIAGALAVADAATVSQLRADAQEYRDSGASIRVLAGEGRIDADACDALAGTGPILAAGALGSAAPILLEALPSNSIPAYVVTPNLAGVLGVTASDGAGIWISRDLARRLYAARGAVLSTPTETLVVAGIYDWPDDGRDTRPGYAILIPTRPAPALDECWASIWPPSPIADDLLRIAARVEPGSTAPLNLARINPNYGTRYDPHAEYESRLSRHAWAAATIGALALGYGGARFRRLNHAGALHAGARKTAVLAVALVETLAWAVAGALIAVAALALIVRAQSPGDARAILAIDLKGIFVTIPAAMAGAAVAIAGCRERHLFRYFKDR